MCPGHSGISPFPNNQVLPAESREDLSCSCSGGGSIALLYAGDVPCFFWFAFYFTFLTNRVMIVATCARVAVPRGESVVSSMPVIRPVPTAQLMASFA